MDNRYVIQFCECVFEILNWILDNDPFQSKGISFYISPSFCILFYDIDVVIYFRRKVLGSYKSTGIGDLGGVKWDLALCLFSVYLVVFLSLWRGIKASGKVVWVTATMPYICLLALLARGVTLEGAVDGIYFYLNPKWELLSKPAVRIIHSVIFHIGLSTFLLRLSGYEIRKLATISFSWQYPLQTVSPFSY